MQNSVGSPQALPNIGADYPMRDWSGRCDRVEFAGLANGQQQTVDLKTHSRSLQRIRLVVLKVMNWVHDPFQ